MSVTDVIFELNGAPAGTPKNSQELAVKLDWEGDNAEQEITVTKLSFVNDDLGGPRDAEYLFQRVATGMAGGVGIFEGIPYRISVKSNSVVSEIFSGYIDLTRDANFISCDEVEANIQKTRSIDWLNDVADSFSFAYLASLNTGDAGKISSSDYIKIPYVLNYRPEAFALITLSVTTYLTAKELGEAITRLSDSIADVIKATTPNAGIPPSVDLGDIIAATINAIANVVYVAAISIALISLIKELIEQLFPPVRKHQGIYYKTMLEKGCEYLGLTLSCSILNDPKWKNLAYMGAKDIAGNGLGTNDIGHPNAQSPIYTFGDCIRRFQDLTNSEIKLDAANNVLYLERRDFYNSTSSFIMPDVETNQDKRLSEVEYNTDEIPSNYLLSFQTDVQDKNTLENFRGTNYRAITTPVAILNPDMVLIRNLFEVRFPFALATRKDGLTFTERTLREVAIAVDAVIGFFGGNSGLAASINNRVGMLSLSEDTTSVSKLLIIENENIPANDSDQLNAKDLWNDFHYINSFVPITDPNDNTLKHSQYYLYKDVTIPFCHSDFVALLANNRFKTTSGDIGEIINLEWSIFQDTAKVSYKINKLYTKNLKLAFNEGK